MATPTTKTTKTTKSTTKPKSSSTRSKTSSSAATATASEKSVAAAATPAPAKVVDAPQPVVLGPMMRKPELINAVVAKSGMKKKDVKPIVEATLSVLGAALQDARELNLEPMGKIKVTREKKRPVGKVLVARIRQTQDLPTEVANPDPKDLDDDTSVASAAE